MNRLSQILLLLGLGLVGCEKPTSPSIPLPPTPDLRSIVYEQVGYTSYSIRHSPDTVFVSADIVSIAVGRLDSGSFVVTDSLSSVYSESARSFTINFASVVGYSPWVPTVTLRLRYIYSDDSWFDIDTTLSTFKFPYPSTEILWNTEDYFGFEDLDVLDSLLLCLENNRLVLHNLATGETSTRNVSCYEVLTVGDGRYVYYDNTNWSLYRYDLIADTSVLFVHHPRDPAYLDMGLEIQDSVIWELLYINPKTTLYKYALPSGRVLDSIAMPHGLSRMTIHDNVVFMETYSGRDEIRRFDLSSRTFLPPLMTPSPGGEGIRIRDGYFYFSNFSRSSIGRVPLADFLDGDEFSSITGSSRGTKSDDHRARRLDKRRR